MFRTLSQRLAAAAFTVASLALPSALLAQKALVYCPVGIDANGCTTIVAALTANGTLFPDGVDAGYDGTSGTVDLAAADLSAYSVFVVPSLADGPDVQPYALLRNGTIAARLHDAFMGRGAVWSGTADVGTTNRSAKDNLLRNLAAWAKPDPAGTHGPGVVALQDNSDDPAARYGWLGGISQLSVTADNTLDVYANVQVLTTTGQTILTGSGGLQIGYANMASYGLVATGASNDATGGRSTRVVLMTVAGEPSDPNLATINTDKDDYQPGDTVLVTGAGWAPGETVSLLFHEDLDPPVHPDKTFTAVADADGHIVNHDYLIDEEDLNVRFTLQATGLTSGKTAQATFTDAVNFQSVAVGTQTPTPIAPGASATYPITVGFSGNNTPLCTVALSVTTALPSGVTASFSPATVAAPNGANQTSTLTIATGAGTPTGVTSFNVRGIGTACTGTQNGTGSLDVKRSSTTTVSGPATSSFGSSVTFGVTVSGGGATPTGTVQFKDGATNLGAAQTLSGGTASVNTSTLTVGLHSITAVYGGDGNYTGGTSGAFSHTVTQADQTITFTSTAPAAAVVGGTAYTAAATATSGLTVTFTSQTPLVCTSSGTNGATITFIAAGPCTVAANQAGNGNFNAAPQVTQNFSVGKGTQAILFTSTAPGGAAVGGPAYTAAATGGASGNPVTFSTTTPSVCTSSGTNGATIGFLAAGSCSVAADQAGNTNYNAATQVTQTFTVGKANQTIAFDLSGLSAKTFGDADFSVASFATASSGLTVSFSSGSITRCTVSAVGQVHIITAAGNCMVVASQAGDASYNAAPNVTQTFNVAKASQTITFTSTAPVGAIVGGPTYTATATATSGLAVTFSSLTIGVCTSGGTNGATITFVGGGTCTVAANQAGNGDYGAAPQVTQSFAVSAQASQTISFTSIAPSAAVFGGSYAVSATATSGLTVAFSSLTTGVCTVTGGTVNFVGVGSCTVAADQAGNAGFLAAPQVTQTFAVGKADQTITFAALDDKTFGDPDFLVSASASSGLGVSFTAGGNCTVATATVHLTGAGSCTVTASQAGNANYSPAADVPRTFSIGKAAQAIVFGALGNKTFGNPDFSVSATGGASGNPVTFGTSTPSICSVSGATVHIIHAGGCTITADQAGNDDYAAAPQASQGFTIAKAHATIALSDLNQTFDGTQRVVTATTTPAGLTVVTIAYDGSTTAPINAGDYGIIASLDNQDYEATDATGTLHVAKATPVFTNLTSPTITFGDTPTSLSGTISKGSAIPTGNVAITLNGGVPKNAAIGASDGSFSASFATGTLGVAASPYGITYHYAGDVNFFGADGTGSLTVIKADQTIAFGALGNKTYGDPAFSVSASASSGLGVTFSSQTTTHCTVAGTTVTITGAGTCTIRTSQAGNDNYNAAPDVDQSLTIYKAPLGVAVLDAALQPYSKSVYFADPIPAYSVKYTGFVYSDDQSVLGGTSTFGYYQGTTKFTPPPPLAVGSYQITAVLTSPNYTITITPGQLQILAWTLSGFYAPVDVPAGGAIWNTVKGGSTVPLKFEIFSGTHELTDPNTAVKPQPNGFVAAGVTCPNNAPTDDIEFTTTGGTVLRYDGTAGQFVQNWQTPKKPGTCYKTTMTAQDGSSIYAFFILK
jgi:hypothetical protein